MQLIVVVLGDHEIHVIRRLALHHHRRGAQLERMRNPRRPQVAFSQYMNPLVHQFAHRRQLERSWVHYVQSGHHLHLV